MKYGLIYAKSYLDGSIPKSISNLSDLESFDLSHNYLSSQIPPELVALQSLAFFSVAYNNLFGPTTGTKGQFIIFGQNNYVLSTLWPAAAEELPCYAVDSSA